MFKNRKVFFYKNSPITAGGVLFYKKTENGLELLLLNKKNKFEDIGGKTEFKDRNILETICREVSEETNNLIKKCDLIDRLKNSEPIYSYNSKYLIFLIEADEFEKNLNKKDFQDVESKNKLKRTIKWIDYKEYLNFSKCRKLNFRLMKRNIFEKLKTCLY